MVADRAGLGFVGFIFAGVTALVMLTAATVVVSHADGHFADRQDVRVVVTR